MSRKVAIRWFFIGLVPLLFVQLLIAKRYEEPYPAVMFPGFGQVPPAPWFPYPFERLVVYAHTPTDSMTLTLEELFAPFPELTQLPTLRSHLRRIADTLSATRDEEAEQELCLYLRDQARRQTGEDVQRLEFTFYQYRASREGDISYVGIARRKVLYF